MTAKRANALNGSDWLKKSFSIWRGFAKDTTKANHPAPFPVSLASQIIDCYVANRDGVALDPFAGSGSTLIAAAQAGMSAVGFDINPDYLDVFKKRLTAHSVASNQWCYEIQDARTLTDKIAPASAEICITSPPYWDILSRRRTADGKQAKSYSKNKDDLGNIDDYDEFLTALQLVAKQINISLRSQGYFILNVMDIRKGPIFYPLHHDATTAILASGNFSLEDIIVWDRQSDYNSMRPLGYPYKFIINKVHEYLLVFRKLEK